MYKSQKVKKWLKCMVCGFTLLGIMSPVGTDTVMADTKTVKTLTDARAVTKAVHGNTVQLRINGATLKTAVKPYVKGGIGYVPLQTVLDALGYQYRVKGNQITVMNGSRTTVLTENSQTIKMNGKKITVKGKVQKVGKAFMVSADTVHKSIGNGIAGYYVNQKAISIRVPVSYNASPAIRAKYSPSHQVEAISFRIPEEWQPYIQVTAPHQSDLTEQELQVTVNWVENGLTTYLATVLIRDEYDLTAKQWNKWFTEGLETRVLKENGVMFSYVTVGSPTEELLKPENEVLFNKIADIVNKQLSDVMGTMTVTTKKNN